MELFISHYDRWHMIDIFFPQFVVLWSILQDQCQDSNRKKALLVSQNLERADKCSRSSTGIAFL